MPTVETTQVFCGKLLTPPLDGNRRPIRRCPPAADSARAFRRAAGPFPWFCWLAAWIGDSLDRAREYFAMGRHPRLEPLSVAEAGDEPKAVPRLADTIRASPQPE